MLRTSSKYGLSGRTACSSGKMCFLSTAGSYTSAELNIASACSWYGKIQRSSPRRTLSHIESVCSIVAPRVSWSRTMRLSSRISAVEMRLWSSRFSVVSALTYSR